MQAIPSLKFNRIKKYYAPKKDKIEYNYPSKSGITL